MTGGINDGSCNSQAAFESHGVLGGHRDTAPARHFGHMTGSGGGFFAIARDPAHATALADAARTAGFVARACRTVHGWG